MVVVICPVCRFDSTVASGRRDNMPNRPLDVLSPFGPAPVKPLDLAPLLQAAGARQRLGALRGVDPERREVETQEGERVSYDALVIATGARARPALAGALTFRGEPDVASFHDLLAGLSGTRSVAFVLPGGVTAAALRARCAPRA